MGCTRNFLLLAIVAVSVRGADIPAIGAYIDLLKNEAVYARPSPDGTLPIILRGHLRISAQETRGLLIPVTIAGGKIGVRTAVWLDGVTKERDVTWYYTYDVEGIAEGTLTLENSQDLSLPWGARVKVPREGGYDAVLAVAFINAEGKKVVLHSAPMHFMVEKVANQSSEPAPASVTPPAGQESRPR